MWKIFTELDVKQLKYILLQSTACVDCVIEWGAWSECENNQNTRTQYVLIDSMGAGAPCPSLQTETEGEQLNMSCFSTKSDVNFISILIIHFRLP